MPIDRANITFWLDGVSSEELGIKVTAFPTFSGAEPRVTKYSVPGRNGDLTYWDGSYKNTAAELSCFIADASKVELALTAVNNWLRDCGYKKFVISSELGRYRKARITNAAEVAIRMGVLAPFTIKLDCKPQRFFDNETPLHYTQGGGEVYNATGFDALPLLRFYISTTTSIVTAQDIKFSNARGDFRLILNDIFRFSDAQWIDIDMEKKSAVTDTGDILSITTDPTGFPVFCAGVTAFSAGSASTSVNCFSGVDLYPRWWTL